MMECFSACQWVITWWVRQHRIHNGDIRLSSNLVCCGQAFVLYQGLYQARESQKNRIWRGWHSFTLNPSKFVLWFFHGACHRLQKASVSTRDFKHHQICWLHGLGAEQLEWQLWPDPVPFLPLVLNQRGQPSCYLEKWVTKWSICHLWDPERPRRHCVYFIVGEGTRYRSL